MQAGARCSYALMDNRKLVLWGTNGSIKKQRVPIEYQSTEDEIYYLKNDFRPIKICTSWSRTVSLTYLLMADCRYLNNKSPTDIEMILKRVSKEWEADYYERRQSLPK